MRKCPREMIVYKKLPTPKYKLNIILTKRFLSLITVQCRTHDLRAALNSRKHSWLCSKGLVSGPGGCGNNRILSRGLGQICCSCMAPLSPKKWDISMNSGSEDAQADWTGCVTPSLCSQLPRSTWRVRRDFLWKWDSGMLFQEPESEEPQIPCRNQNTGCFWGSIPLWF